jgi:5-(carboxyamino)imidazole ribonucleotide mutase
MPRVCIVMGSKSDEDVVKKAVKVLNELNIDYEVRVASAHRTPEKVVDIATRSDADVFIAVAGLSAALPGVIAAHTLKPVIGVPVSGKLNLDSLLSIVQMPPGVPVAAVGLDRGENAALLAARIIALSDDSVKVALHDYMEKMKKKVESDDVAVRDAL